MRMDQHRFYVNEKPYISAVEKETSYFINIR